MKHCVLSVLFICSAFITNAVSFDYTIEQIDNTQQSLKISLNFTDEAIFSKSLHLSTDHPDFEISSVTVQGNAQETYLPSCKETHNMYTESFTLNATIQQTASTIQSLDQHVYLNFQTYPDLKTVERTIPVTSLKKSTTNTNSLDSSYDEPSTEYAKNGFNEPQKEKSYAVQIEEMIKNTNSLWIQMLLVLLLGLFFSLTPCIYPMIPITIGILHQNGKQSVWQNFFGSLSYASGLATTFACLGLLAAFAGASFGSALSNPIFVAFIVIFLGYMALTMIGVIDMYTPKFMRGGAQINSNLGPILSTFLFGLISGTIASPCVSPGLFFLLTLVADMGNYFFGFALLFIFGIGMNMPLMAIATFSNSTKFLPKSGMWMVEVKRMLGFMMFMMCFYYLENVVPYSILIWFITLYLLIVALYYIVSAQSSQDHKKFKSFVGVALLGLTILIGFKTYELNFTTPKTTIHFETPWARSYEEALDQANKEGKAVLLDFWAHHCGICKAIDSKVFKNEQFCKAIEDTVILYKVDCTHATEQIKKITGFYKVRTQPVILLINPDNEAVLKQWTSEPHSMPIDTFVEEIHAAL